MAQKHLQLLRNGSAYADYQAAYNALITKTTYADGTPILARYSGETGEIKTLLGVVNNASGVARVDIINDVQASILRAYNLEDTITGAIETNDSIEVALNKLENQVKAAEAAATTKVVEGTDTGNNMSIASAKSADDGSVTYTINLTDVASKTALDAEIAARKAVDGQTGQTYTANSDANYISGVDSLNAADVALDTAVASLSGKVDNLDFTLAKDDNKVVVSLSQTDGQVGGTSELITSVKLSGYTEGTDADIAASDTLGEALGKLQAQINAMDKTASAVDGKVVTTVVETDGKVTETKENVKDLQLGGYAKDTGATGDIASNDTVNAALSKLENKVGANKITNADGSITVTEPTGTATTTDVKVNIKSGEKVIKLGNDGIYTNLNLVKITESLPATVKERYELRDSDDAKIGESIDIAKDSHIVSITYITGSTDPHYQNLEYKYIDANGTEQTVYVDMSSLVLEAEFASGVTVTNHVAHGVVDPASEDFLTVGADGFRLSGVQDAIDAAIDGLDVTDTADVNKYVSSVSETDGKISVTKENIVNAKLSGYTKSSSTSAETISTGDTLGTALGKLENNIEKVKGAATIVEEGTDNVHLNITSATSQETSATTYTITLTDVASDTALTAEIAARKAVDGQSGQTYAANTGVNYIGDATSLNNADVKLDAALKALNDETIKTITSTNTGCTVTVSGEGNTRNIAVNTDGSQVKLTGYEATGATGAPAATDSVNAAIAKLYNRGTITSTNSGITVDQSGSATTLTLNVSTDTAAAGTTGATYAQKEDGNAIELRDNGIFVSSNWDCGTY